MRIWSIHPKYLDSKGIVALWRETLLAKNVMEGNTRGYRNHPQLLRFKTSPNPLDAINYFLQHVWLEANKRTYNFNRLKFMPVRSVKTINVSSGQVEFERNHLLGKVKTRDKIKHNEISVVSHFETHPLFKLVEGDIEAWERV